MRESDEDEIFNSRATMTELNNGTQAPINNQVDEPGIRRSGRNRIKRVWKPYKPRFSYSLTFDIVSKKLLTLDNLKIVKRRETCGVVETHPWTRLLVMDVWIEIIIV